MWLAVFRYEQESDAALVFDGLLWQPGEGARLLLPFAGQEEEPDNGTDTNHALTARLVQHRWDTPQDERYQLARFAAQTQLFRRFPARLRGDNGALEICEIAAFGQRN